MITDFGQISEEQRKRWNQECRIHLLGDIMYEDAKETATDSPMTPLAEMKTRVDSCIRRIFEARERLEVTLNRVIGVVPKEVAALGKTPDPLGEYAEMFTTIDHLILSVQLLEEEVNRATQL